MISVILAGGGKGRRIGDIPKAFLTINRRPLIYYSIETFYRKVDEIVVVLPSEYIEEWSRKIKEKYRNIKVVAGGKERQDSVREGLFSLKNKKGLVLIHDVARPLFSCNLVEKLIKGARKYGAAVPYIEIQDTVKERKGDFVLRTINRENVVCIQTPQAFKTELIIKAYNKAYRDGFYATDDAAVVEYFGGKVYLIPGERENIKITYPVDIYIAKEMLKKWKREE